MGGREVRPCDRKVLVISFLECTHPRAALPYLARQGSARSEPGTGRVFFLRCPARLHGTR